MKYPCLHLERSAALSFAVLLVLALLTEARPAAALDITLDAAQTGRTFEGIGAVSAGASSRLLMDYPEPQRGQILDYLFKPNCGAAFHHLKVEIGGDVNSTDGCEPSPMHTRAETNYSRGYEWWLMTQAKARNPAILLDSLAWGAPGWVGNGSFYSQDMANYIVSFIQGAKRVYGLDINYTGTWNEHYPYDTNWIKVLRATLDTSGLQSVGIVAVDVNNSHRWDIAQNVLADTALSNAIYAVGAHYPGYQSTAAAQACGKPLWASEDGIGGPGWSNAGKLAKIYNRNYIEGKMTKTEIWSPVTSYYDNLSAPNSGVMTANTPWSGAYTVSPAIWATAHTTQFAFPGWVYLEGGANGYLPGGGSFVTLKSPNGVDYSIIIETVDATAPQTVTFHPINGLPAGAVHVWQTSATQYFTQLSDLIPLGGAFSLTLDAGGIYSLTTTTGQGKSSAAPLAANPFPFPFFDDFESYAPGGMPKYFSDQAGVFEVAARDDGQGNCLRQVLPGKGIEWIPEFYPYTLFGDQSWRDYDLAADALIETNGFVFLFGRLGTVPAFSGNTPNGYWLSVSNSPGSWTLQTAQTVLASGSSTFAPNVWHRLMLSLTGQNLKAYIDGALVADLLDGSYSAGMAALGCGWNGARFDNVSVVPRHSGPLNLALGATVSSSSVWSADYSPSKANDGDYTTRWNSASPVSSNEWLQLDFGRPTSFNRTVLTQFADRIMGYKIQHWDGAAWTDDALGGQMGAAKADAFSRVTANQVRLLVTNTTTTPSVYEFEVYDDEPATNLALGASASASSIWSSSYTAAKANDNDFTTRWNAASGTTNNQWLQLDFGAPVTFNKTILTQFADRVTGYKIQYWTGAAWADTVTGGQLGAHREDTFPPITASKVRFYVAGATNVPSIYEFQVFFDQAISRPMMINEWMVSNDGSIADPADGRFEAWFELYNPSTATVNLMGYYLTANPANRSQYQIPAGYSVPPGGFLLVWADDEPGQNQSGADLHVNFFLTNAPVIGLFDPSGAQVDLVRLQPQPAAGSLGSLPDGSMEILPTAAATPRGSNNQIRVLSVRRAATDGTVTLTFQGIPGQRHRIQCLAQLGSLDWLTLGSVTARADGWFQFLDMAGPSAPRRFYRAVSP